MTASSQGILSASDSSQKSVSRCMPHTKEQIISEGLQRTSGSLVGITSDMLPIYTAQTTSRRGTTVLTDVLTWDYYIHLTLILRIYHKVK